MANSFTSNPIVVDTAMTGGYQAAISAAAGNKFPLRPKRIEWFNPSAAGDTFNIVDPVFHLSVPAAPTLGSVAGGALAATTYFVKITYVTPYGETLASAEASQAVALNNLLTVTSPAAVTGASGWNVYVSTTTGTETKQNGSTPIAIGTNYTEATSGLVAGAALPAASTADRYILRGRAEANNQSQIFDVSGQIWADFQVSAITAGGTLYIYV